ncbi:hypothetical protein GM415_07870 [Pseudodesulfovibrio cashew]|uniref:DUF4136 domain-containing protein n=1 Tax=Pseudodesulfovibrio cashew TaxID=2678688 RepID=A0A6I6JB93_9BACT|nr:LPS assembly lipoprotein LptE [Pseudodesulfovibrio cashew]QGY40046.1 hypothetical protein GM415_07870 [Pseudodesulfovibrio cashew]
MRHLYACLVLLLPLTLAACGYSFGDKGHSVLQDEYRVLAISGVDNPTTLTWLEPRIRKLLRDELTNRGTVTWTDDRRKADALIQITVERYYRPTAVEGSGDTTLRSNANFNFHATISSALDDHVIWRSGSISQNWPFFSGQETQADEEVTRLGIRRLADKMEQNY